MGRDDPEVGGILSLASAQERESEIQNVWCFPKSFNIQWSDLRLLMQCRWVDFQHRDERRLFDMVDIHRTGYVTLDEIIHFRENFERMQAAKDSLEMVALPLLEMKPTDISRSLVALYHFDVRLDGHLSFEEFLLLQDYLRQVEKPEEEVWCWCIPRLWSKRGRKRKNRRPNRHQQSQEKGEEGEALVGEDGIVTPSRGRHEGDRLMTRRVNAGGELQDIDIHAGSSPHRAGSSDESPQRNAPVSLQRESSEWSNAEGWSPHHGMVRNNSNTSLDSEDDAEDAAEEKKLEEKKLQDRRAMLMMTLKSKKGRKRFIEWLYKIADSSHDDKITIEELLVFLKAIRADGINPETFVDPAEDYHDFPTGRENSLPMESDGPLDRRNPFYLKVIAERIMLRYNDSKTGSLSREEFMQLASMVEREYEFSDNNYSGADMIGPYCFKRTLGKGAEGVVKLAINTQTGEKKAIKIIKKGNIAEMSRVDVEVEAMVMLDHPNVVSVNEVLETESSIFLVMEYCAGGHLEDYISPNRPMSEAAASFYFSQLLNGLLYCHGKGVAHRDLRVENLMLDNKGNLKITDFGHAGIFQQGWDMFQTMLVGSVSHLAPEQVTGTVYSGEKIDMWSLGIILYIMVCGTAPFQGGTPEELLENIKLVKYIPPEGISRACADIITCTLQGEQQARSSCEKVKEMDWLSGPKEKLVLAHGEFIISEKVSSLKKFMDELRSHLAEQDTTVADKTTTFDAESGIGLGDDEVEANVRTVADDEDSESHLVGLRTVSVTVLHCVHDIRKVVFKVVVSMMSKDGGKSNLTPVIAFDLQSGDAAIFQRVLRKVRSAYAVEGRLCQTSARTNMKAVPDEDDDAPLVKFAALGMKFSNSSQALIQLVSDRKPSSGLFDVKRNASFLWKEQEPDSPSPIPSGGRRASSGAAWPAS
mmetsp:Transcript_62919/g.150547  ORF Transcript_62919/g.150547 Transcript_62919/m.150547 type:complete len:926 (+) Transcript_62919:90-2867(+)